MRLVWVLVVVVGIQLERAEACTCAWGRTFELFATRVRGPAPVDFAPLVRAGPTYELVKRSTGDVVPMRLVPGPVEGYVRVVAKLRPNTAYELTRRFEGEGKHAPPPEVMSFTTGAASRTLTRPGTIEIQDLTIEYAVEAMTSCGGEAARIHATLSNLSGSAALAVRVTGGGRVQELLVPAAANALEGVGMGQCAPTFVDLRKGERYAISIQGVDHAGNAGPVTAASADVIDCGRFAREEPAPEIDCVLTRSMRRERGGYRAAALREVIREATADPAPMVETEGRPPVAAPPWAIRWLRGRTDPGVVLALWAACTMGIAGLAQRSLRRRRRRSLGY